MAMQRFSGAVVCLLLVLLADPAWGQANYEKELSVYKNYVGRPSLRMRTRGRDRFAGTGDVRALKILSASYARAERPKDQVRYLLTTICADRCDEGRFVPIYDAWRQRHTRPQDAWLWHRALEVRLMHKGPDELIRVAQDPKLHMFLRGAAVLALSYGEEPDVLPLIPKLLKDVPDKPLEHAVLAETCATGLLYQREHLGSDEFRAAALKVIRQLDIKKTPPRTRLVIARHLGKLFKTDTLVTNGSEPWRQLLIHGEAKKVEQKDDRYGTKRPTFVGIEATGNRICYVIDMSDSMMEPLTGKEKESMKGPITGRKVDPKKKDGLLGEGDLDWSKIKNRFDAAREYLRLSLLNLDEDKHYAVIFFGTRARLLKTTPGLVKATRANVVKTIQELRAFRPGPRKADRPHGTLMGKTNMHGGLHRAFKIKGRGMVKQWEYVHPATFKGGCDTIFLLSDGQPVSDDWGKNDKKDDWDMAGDPETGARHDQDTDQLFFEGPYGQSNYLLDDVRRMNMFRRVEIHCIGMGEANSGFLSQLAATGLGKVKMVGKTRKKAGDAKRKS